MVGHADEFGGLSRHQLFLVETGTTALYAIQVLVYFVGAVERDFDQSVSGQGVEFQILEAGFENDLIVSPTTQLAYLTSSD